MRHLFLLPALSMTLLAAEPLEVRLQKAQRLSTEALRQLQGELALADISADAKAYHEAHLGYLMAARRQAKEPKADLALLDRAIQILEARKDADSKALQGACLGVKIGFSPMSGMTLAPKASALFEAALQQSPGNPRVLMLQGVHVLHTPAFFGGGAKAALPTLVAAVNAAAVATAPADPLAPAWGRAESLAWLALAEVELGQKAEAKSHVDQALALDANYGFARFVVLPKVQGGAP